MIRSISLFLGIVFHLFFVLPDLTAVDDYVPGCADPEEFLTELLSDSVIVVHWDTAFINTSHYNIAFGSVHDLPIEYDSALVETNSFTIDLSGKDTTEDCVIRVQRICIDSSDNSTYSNWVEFTFSPSNIEDNQNEVCDNGIDDDEDGLIDCLDGDCAPTYAYEITPPTCPDKNDGVITLTVTSPDFTSPTGISEEVVVHDSLSPGSYEFDITSIDGCVVTIDTIVIDDIICPEICSNGIDDDTDGLIDCEDDDCSAFDQNNNSVCDFDETCPVGVQSFLSFAGGDDRVTFDNAALPQGSAPRTFEAWIRTTQTSGSRTIFDYGLGNTINPDAFQFTLRPSTGISSVRLDMRGGISISHRADGINDGRWHHIAIVYPGGPFFNTRFYLDGQARALLSATNQSGIPNTVGTMGYMGLGLVGHMDEVRMWDRALEEEEVLRNICLGVTGQESGLVTYYNFDQGICGGDNTALAEPSLIDLINGNNGTLENFAKTGCTSNYACSGSLCEITCLYDESICAAPINEICVNGVDDDGDGLIDCNDPDCNYNILGDNEPVVVQPGPNQSKDAVIMDQFGGSSFGTYLLLNAEAKDLTNGVRIVRGLIDFDELSQLSNAIVQNATLTLYANQDFPSTTEAGDNEVRVYLVTEPWERTSVTWDGQPTVDTDDFVTIPSQTSLESVDVDLTTLTQKYVDGDYYGFMLQLTTENPNRSMSFHSSDGNDPTKFPKLSLTLESDLEVTDATCPNNDNGIISYIGGQSNLSFSINGVDYGTNPIFENLVPGDYTLYAQTEAGCVSTYDIMISGVVCTETNCADGIDDDNDGLIDCDDPDCISTYSYEVTDPTCPESNNGSITVDVGSSSSTFILKKREDNLVAYYPFNQNANDQSCNEHHGIVNGPVLTSDRFGNPNSAYEFDGVDDYIDVPHSDDFNLSNLTISCWVLDYSMDNSNMILLKGRWSNSGENKRQYSVISNLNGTNPVHHFGLLKSNLLWDNCESPPTNIVGSWTHITVTYDGNTQKIYRNSELVAECQSTQENHTPSSPESMLIGAGFNTELGWLVRDGKLDELRIYNKALSEIEIEELFNQSSAEESQHEIVQNTPVFENLEGGEYLLSVINDNGCIGTSEISLAAPICFETDCSNGIDDDGDGLIDFADDDCATIGLVGRYLFTDGSAEDNYGSNDGVITGAIPVEDRFCTADDALLFDETSAVSLGDNYDYFSEPDNRFSFSFWFRLDALTGLNEPIVSKYGSSSCTPGISEREFFVRVNGDNRVEFAWFGSLSAFHARRVQSSTQILNKCWHHVTVNYRGDINTNDGHDRVELFIDGVRDSLTTLVSIGSLMDIANGNSHLAIGGNLNTSGQTCEHSFRGAIDDVYFYNRELSTAEAYSLYSQGATTTVTPPDHLCDSCPAVELICDNGIDDDFDGLVDCDDPDCISTYSYEVTDPTCPLENDGVITFAISDSVRSVRQVTLNDGLQAYYRFDSTLTGQVFPENDLQVTSGTLDFETIKKTDEALALDGNTTVTMVGNFDNSGFTQSAVSAWFNVSAATAEGQIIIQGASIGFSLAVASNNSELIGFNDGSSADALGSGASIDTDRWYHAVLQSDGATSFLYLDGVLVDHKDEPLFLGTGGSNNKFYFGKTNLGLGAYTGLVNEVRVYDRMLTTAEIIDLGNAAYTEDTIIVSDVTPGLYQFDVEFESGCVIETDEFEIIDQICDEDCSNGFDDDGDGLIDCDDPDCAPSYTFQTTLADCFGEDNSISVLSDDSLGLSFRLLDHQLVQNADFEQGPSTSNGLFRLVNSVSTAIDNWVVESGSVDYVTSSFWPAAHGTRSLDMNGDEAGSIYQEIATISGQQYVVEFDMASNPDCGDPLKTLQVSTGASSQTYTHNSTGNNKSNIQWETMEFSFTASDVVTRLTFSSLSTSRCGPTLDNIVIYRYFNCDQAGTAPNSCVSGHLEDLPTGNYDLIVSTEQGCSDTIPIVFNELSCIEANCSDGIDDDGDGLVDCADDDCFIDFENSISFKLNNVDGRDAIVNSSTIFRDVNYGTAPSLNVQSWTDNANGSPLRNIRTHIDFPIESVLMSASSNIDQAILTLHEVPGYTSSFGGQHGDNPVSIHLITQPWQEEIITWNNQPTYLESPSVVIPRNNDYEKIDVDVAELLNKVIEDNSPFYGFMLRQVTEDDPTRVMVFSSSEATDQALTPELSIFFGPEIIVTNATCPDNNDGSIEVVDPMDKLSLAQFRISQDQPFISNTLFQNLIPGDYLLEILNEFGCIESVPFTIGGDTPFASSTINIITTDATCLNEFLGSVFIGHDNEGDPFSNYSIDGGLTFGDGPSFTDLGEGTYDIYFEDTNGCIYTDMVTVGLVLEDYATISEVNVTTTSCDVMTSSTIEVLMEGDFSNYEYNLSGIEGFQSSNTFENVAEGLYELIVRNPIGCTETTTVSVGGSYSGQVDVTYTLDGCFGSIELFTGSQDVIDNTQFFLGEDGPFQFNVIVDEEGGSTTGSYIFESLLPTVIYELTIEDNFICTRIDTIDFSVAPEGGDGEEGGDGGPIDVQNCAVCSTVDMITVYSPTANCSDSQSYLIASAIEEYTIGVEIFINGSGPFSFDDLPPASVPNNGELFYVQELGAGGSYNVVLRDVRGCEQVYNIEVPDPIVLRQMAGPTVIQPSCPTLDDGSIELFYDPLQQGSNQTLPQYSLDGVSYSTSSLFENLTPGDYTVYVLNDAGCGDTLSIALETDLCIEICNNGVDDDGDGDIDCDDGDCQPMVVEVITTVPSCPNRDDGLIQFIVSNNSYDGIDTTCLVELDTIEVSSVAPGDYVFTLSNDLGCARVTDTVRVERLDCIELCGNDMDDDGDGLIDCDDADCLPTYTYEVTTPGCPDKNDGIITLYVSSPGGLEDTIAYEDLSPGDYQYDISSTDGCTMQTEVITIADFFCPEVCNNGIDDDGDGLTDCADSDCDPTYTYQLVPPTCPNKTGGEITLQVTSSDGSVEEVVHSDLTPGDYQFDISSVDGCTAQTAVITIDDIPCPEICDNNSDDDLDGLIDCEDGDCLDQNDISLTVTDATCPDNDNGSLEIDPDGQLGILQFRILPDGSFTTGTSFENLSEGDYQLEMLNESGCLETFGFTIGGDTLFPPSTINIIATDADCTNEFKGSIHITNINDSGAFPDALTNYSIDGGMTTQAESLFEDLDSGTYFIYFEDRNGCIYLDTVDIEYDITDFATVSDVIITPTSCDPEMGSRIELVMEGDFSNYQYNITFSEEFQSSPIFENVGVGSYEINIVGPQGCAELVDVQVKGSYADQIRLVYGLDGCDGKIELFADDIDLKDSVEIYLDGNGPFLLGEVVDEEGGQVTGYYMFDQLFPINIYSLEIIDVTGCSRVESIDFSIAPMGGEDGESISIDVQKCEECSTLGMINVYSPTGSCDDGQSYLIASGLEAYTTGVSVFVNGDGPFAFDGTPPAHVTDTGDPFFVQVANAGDTYNVVLIDARGCEVSYEIIVEVSPQLISISDPLIVQPTCPSLSDGSIELFYNTVVGGENQYPPSFSLDDSNYSEESKLENLVPGDYIVYVQNVLGCTDQYSFTLDTQVCIETDCNNGIDDDGDGLVDCADDDCTYKILGPAQDISFNPGSDEGKDAVVQQLNGTDRANTNYPDNPYLSVEVWTAGGIRRTTRAITDFTDLPTLMGESIEQATLTLHGDLDFVSASNGQSGNNEVTIHLITEPWEEQTVTFNNQPAFSIEHTIVIPSMLGYSEVDIDVTPLIEEYLKGGYYGFLFKHTDEVQYKAMYFQSSDAPDPGVRPRLTLETEGDIIVTPATCPDNNNGSIEFLMAEPDLTFSIDGVTYSDEVFYDGLSVGMYTAYVQTVSGCVSTIDLEITGEALPVIDNVQVTDATCPDNTNGSIQIITTEGDVTFSIDGAAYQSTSEFTNLSGGSYTVYVKNASGCITTEVHEVGRAICPEVCNNGVDDDGDGIVDCADEGCQEAALTVTGIDAECPDYANGMIEVSIPRIVVYDIPNLEENCNIIDVTVLQDDPELGEPIVVSQGSFILEEGVITYTVLGSSEGGEEEGSNGSNALELLPGSYTLSIGGCDSFFDKMSCVASLSIDFEIGRTCAYEICDNEIDDDANGLADCDDPGCGLPIIDDVVITKVSCNDRGTYQAEVIVQGDATSYEYKLGSGQYQSSAMFTGLKGSFGDPVTFTVRNIEGCESTFEVFIPLNLSSQVEDSYGFIGCKSYLEFLTYDENVAQNVAIFLDDQGPFVLEFGPLFEDPSEEAYRIIWTDLELRPYDVTIVDSEGCEISGSSDFSVLNFDGIDDYVDLGPGPNDEIRTIELWFKPSEVIDSSIPTYQPLVVRNAASGNIDEFNLAFQHEGTPRPGHLGFTITESTGNENQIYSDRNTWEQGRWYHVAVVVSPTDGMAMFIDGIKQSETSNYNLSPAVTNFPITLGNWGNQPDLDRYFNGSMRGVRFSNVAISAAGFLPQCSNISIEQTTVGHWILDEGSGTLANDQSVNDNDGTIIGATWGESQLCGEDFLIIDFSDPILWDEDPTSCDCSPVDEVVFDMVDACAQVASLVMSMPRSAGVGASEIIHDPRDYPITINGEGPFYFEENNSASLAIDAARIYFIQDYSGGEFFTIEVGDINGCMQSYTYDLPPPGKITQAREPVITHPSCPDKQDGAITFFFNSISSVTPLGEISYDPIIIVDGTALDSNTIEGLAPGVYDVTVTNELGCSFNTTIELLDDPCSEICNNGEDDDGDGLVDCDDPDCAPQIGGLIGSQVTCNNYSDGTVEIQVSNASFDGQGFECEVTDESITISSLIPGDYVFKITNDNGCQINTDTVGVILAPNEIGSPCDDGNICTNNDVWEDGCNCRGTYIDTDADGICDTEDPDDDNDGCLDEVDPNPQTASTDTDGDTIGDDCDICDGDDATGDTDGDGICDDQDPDDDGDGCLDEDDTNALVASIDSDGDSVADDCDICDGDDATGDTDGDGICNDQDPDDDNDGCLDEDDSNALVASSDSDGDSVADDCDICDGDDATGDTDGDGICNDQDPDDDNDGCLDVDDANPLVASTDSDGDSVADDCDICDGDDATGDTDGDGICNDQDDDDDNDGCLDVDDASPLVASTDSDGDSVADDCDICDGDDATGDTDGDGICNDQDPDDDNDGCLDPDDLQPLIASSDSDNDGTSDDCDLCSGNDTSGDTDNDGICNDQDPDDDNDGCLDADDPAPLTSSTDSDGDGTADDCDLCTGDDDVGDTDGDGICDDQDTDDDNDGCLDVDDDNPLSPSGDSDGDSVADDCDICEGDDSSGDSDDDGICDNIDLCPGYDDNVDTNNNNIPDGCDDDFSIEIGSTDFSGSTDPFVYESGAFGTSQPNYETTAVTEEGITITLGGVDDEDIENMSGGWTTSITLPGDCPISIALTYEMIMASDYEPGEISELRISVDGSLILYNGNLYIDQLEGDGNGGPEMTTGVQSVIIPLGELTAGAHTLTIGIWNNIKTLTNESTSLTLSEFAIIAACPEVAVDTDGDGVLDIVDLCEGSDDSIDTDSDGLPDGCDACIGIADSDGDGVCDPDDLCNASITLIDANFESSDEGFSYVTGAFSSPTDVDEGSYTGSALEIELGGDIGTVLDMSGGFGVDLDLPYDGDISIKFTYNLTMDNGYEPDEYSEVLLEVDGVRYGRFDDEYIQRLVGDENGGVDVTTGLQTVEIIVPDLAQGTHSVIIGGYNNKKTILTEITSILIDDVTVSIACPDVQSDQDGDMVIDELDQCPGSDDNIDTDSDGIPDGCDPCIGIPDVDGDGICDNEDLCIEFIIFDEASFDGGSDGFVYLENANPTFINGTSDDQQLNIEIAGVNNVTINNTSAEWQSDIVLPYDASLRVTLDYNLTMTSEFEAGEISEFIIQIDDSFIEDGDNPYFAQLEGDGNGGPEITTGTETVTFNTNALPAGEHTLSFILLNTQSTWGNEISNLTIDNVIIEIACPEDQSDSDGDQVLDVFDTCPGSDDTVDIDNDGVPDGCDPCPGIPDIDGDGICDDIDNCIFYSLLDNSNYDSGSDGYVYTEQSNTNFVSGSTGGQQLSITLEGENNITISNTSASWSKDVSLPYDGDVRLTFDYNLTLAADYEPGEISELRLLINGTAITVDGSNFIAQLEGDGNGGSDFTTGTQNVTIEIPALVTGSNTIEFNLFNTQTTWGDEITTLIIDNVEIELSCP